MANGVTPLDFEKPLYELEKQIEELKKFAFEKGYDMTDEIQTLERKALQLKEEIYNNLTTWQKIMIARHLKRPTCLDYINLIFDDFIELHGDRNYSDDLALVGGVAKLDGIPVTIIGQQKGRDTNERITRNFGQPHPEGYRKAKRLMLQAEKFNRPIISFIDVAGAYPGVGAEERGQGLAIAENLYLMSALKVPIIVIITGEGGSGGALGIGVGDRVFILSNAYYSVITPEGCASILYKDTSKTQEAADTLKITAIDLKSFNIVDDILPEPLGGAHKNSPEMASTMKECLLTNIKMLKTIPVPQLLEIRYNKFRVLGVFTEDKEEKKVKHNVSHA